MLAMSLILAARDFQPKSRQGMVWRVKCAPSTTVSVVKSSVTPMVRQAAVSSPVSTSSGNWGGAASWGRARWPVTMPLSRSMTPNSPRSFTCMMGGL